MPSTHNTLESTAGRQNKIDDQTQQLAASAKPEAVFFHPEVSFEAFAQSIYSDPKVQKACLNLQDNWGLRVNLILLALWSAKKQRCITTPQWRALHRQTTLWHYATIEPLRFIRRRSFILKKLWLKAELECEWAEIRHLERLFPSLCCEQCDLVGEDLAAFNLRCLVESAVNTNPLNPPVNTQPKPSTHAH